MEHPIKFCMKHILYSTSYMVFQFTLMPFDLTPGGNEIARADDF